MFCGICPLSAVLPFLCGVGAIGYQQQVRAVCHEDLGDKAFICIQLLNNGRDHPLHHVVTVCHISYNVRQLPECVPNMRELAELFVVNTVAECVYVISVFVNIYYLALIPHCHFKNTRSKTHTKVYLGMRCFVIRPITVVLFKALDC